MPIADGIRLSASGTIARNLTNSPPVWTSTPEVIFTQGVAGFFPASGTYQSNGYVTDLDGDTITITKNIVVANGITWEDHPTIQGQRFRYTGLASGEVTSGHILTANDGHGGATQSASFIIRISALQWTTTADINITELGGTHDFSADVLNTTGQDEDYSQISGSFPLGTTLDLETGIATFPPGLTIDQSYTVSIRASTLFQSFAERRSQPGVRRWIGFDSAADVAVMADAAASPIAYPGPDLASWADPGFDPVWDSNVSASQDGGGSLRFRVAANAVGGDNQNWFMNFGPQGSTGTTNMFGAGEEFFIQFRQYLSQTAIDWMLTPGSSCPKFCAITCGDQDGSWIPSGADNGRENSTFCEISQIVIDSGATTFNVEAGTPGSGPEIVLNGFHRCPEDGGVLNWQNFPQPGAPTTTPWGPTWFHLQPGRPNYCSLRLDTVAPYTYISRTNPDQAVHPGTCATVWPDEWVTYKWGITLGPWGFVRTGFGANQYGYTNSRVRLWQQRQGQASELVIDITIGLGTSYVEEFQRPFGKFWLVPRGGGAVTHPELFIWYDEVIVSSLDIADAA